MQTIESRYHKRSVFEPYKQTKFYDFWRLYYTAFSQTQDLLVLACPEDKITPRTFLTHSTGNQTHNSSAEMVRQAD